MPEEDTGLFAVAFATVLLKIRHAASNGVEVTLADHECQTLIDAFKLLHHHEKEDDGHEAQAET